VACLPSNNVIYCARAVSLIHPTKERADSENTDR